MIREGRRLLQIVRRGKHGPVRVRRAMIIMASASGTLVPAIARLVAADEDTVRDAIHTFSALRGLAALDPRWAGGRPRLISDGDIEVIVTAARTRPEKPVQPFTRWSLRKLAGYLSGPGPVRDRAGVGRGSSSMPACPGPLLRLRPVRAAVDPAPATACARAPREIGRPGCARLTHRTHGIRYFHGCSLRGR